MISEARKISTALGEVEYSLSGEGPLFVGLHGMPGSLKQMELIFNKIGFPHRRLLLSRPGYDGTPLSSGESMEEQADLLAALLDALQIPAIDCLVAFSCGGVPALEFLRKYPERVKKYISFSCVTGAYDMFDTSSLQKLSNHIAYSSFGLRCVAILYALAPGLLLKLIVSDICSSGIRKEWKRVAACQSDRDFLLKLALLQVPFRVCRKGIWNDNRQISHADSERYRGIQTPMLLFHGTCDGDVPLFHSERMLELVPNSELFLIHGGHHVLMMEPNLSPIRERIKIFLSDDMELSFPED